MVTCNGHTEEKDRIGSGRGGVHDNVARLPSGRPEVSLVGRGKELETLQRRLDRAASGNASILIEGEAGIGKSRLLSEALSRADRRGFVVLQGAADELSPAE